MKNILFLLGFLSIILGGCSDDDDSGLDTELWLGCYYSTQSNPVSCFFYIFPEGEYTEVKQSAYTATGTNKKGEVVESEIGILYQPSDKGYKIQGMSPGKYTIACFPILSAYQKKPYKIKSIQVVKNKVMIIAPLFTPASANKNGYCEWDE